MEYLIRWKGCGPEDDQWKNIKGLQDAKELVKEYEDAQHLALSPASLPSPLGRQQTTRESRRRSKGSTLNALQPHPKAVKRRRPDN